MTNSRERSIQGPNSAAEHTFAESDVESMSAFANVPELDRNSWPRDAKNQPIEGKDLVFMVATYLWFDYLGRRVTREEFEGIVRLQTHDTNYKANHGLLDRLEKPSDELTIAYENAGNKLKDIWIPRVGRRFAQLRQEDRVAKERAQDLVGFIGRVPRIIRTGDHRYRLKWNILLEGYEVLTNYGVINWAKFPNGEAFKESDTREIFAYHYHVNIREKIQSSLDLADDQNGLTMEIRWLASRHQQFVEFAAAEMVRRYEMNILKQEERTFRSIIPLRNPDPATSSGLAASTTEASASSSHQLTVPGLSQGIAALSEFSDSALKSLQVNLSPDVMPIVGDGNRMPILTYCIIYADWNWIRSDGRLLTFEEIQGILGILYGEKDFMNIATQEQYHELFVKLDNNADKASVELEALKDKDKAILKKEGQFFLNRLLENPAAKLRDEHLRGFPWRLTSLPWRWKSRGFLPRPRFEGHIMWDHQVWFMYFLANSCKDSKRRYVSVADAITIVGDYYGYAITIHDSWPAYSNIGDENHSLYRMLTGVMKAGPEIAGHFEPKARDAYKDYSKRGMLANPAPLDSDSGSEGGLDPAATSGMAAMTVGATASNPRMNLQPGPIGGSPKQPSRKGKERARDSSSGTPPEGHRGGAEGKKPQRKHQRTR